MSKTTQGTTDRFWLVWNVGGLAPTRIHREVDEARSEALRLAAKHPGQYFTVLQTMETAISRINPPTMLKCVKQEVEF